MKLGAPQIQKGTSAMMSDVGLAGLCLRSYLPGVTLEVAEDLAALITVTADATIVAFRGTCNIQGWMRDLDARPSAHHLLGYCHNGFLTGGCQMWNAMNLPTDRPIVITGHSLGGALAIIVAGLRLAAGERVDQLVTFGSPRAGFDQLARIVQATVVRQYRRGDDPVTEVPFDLTAFPYKHVEPLLLIGHPASERWKNHDISGYQSDLAALQPMPTVTKTSVTP